MVLAFERSVLMKILVVGGTGMIGGFFAQYLHAKGYDVAIAARRHVDENSPLKSFSFVKVDYVQMEFSREEVASFDTVIFSAGNDVRHFPDSEDDSWYDLVGPVGVPRFFAELKAVGVKRAVNIGSFYPQLLPQLIESNPYIRSRHLSDKGVAALAGPEFLANSVNAPIVVGAPESVVVPVLETYVRYAEGEHPGPFFLPEGGTNFISVLSLAEAVEGAFLRGAPGASYLVGDENLSFADFFGGFFDALGRPRPETRDASHPLLPDEALFWGRGRCLYYEPDQKETELLGYRRQDVQRAVHELAERYRRP